MALVASTAFILGISQCDCFLSLALVSGLGHLAVLCEDMGAIEEVRIDRRVVWGTIGFQVVWIIGVACCYSLGRAVAAMSDWK